MDDRVDVDAETIGVMLPIPPEVAGQFPVIEGNGEPHITAVYVGPGSEDAFQVVLDAAAQALPAVAGETVELGGLGYFDDLPGSFAGGRAAYAEAKVSDVSRAQRDAIEQAIRDAGIDVQHYTHNGQWNPHATLAYLGAGETYDGQVPTGAWAIDSIEVWRGDQRLRLYADGRRDRLGRKGEKWVALSEDGKTELGTYDTEAEARERLRQVEAAKAAKGDGPSDTEGSALERADDRQQVLFEPTGDGGFRVTLPIGAQIQFAESPANAARSDAVVAAVDTLVASQGAPAVHTESRTNTEWITRADRVSLPTEHAPIVHPDGWVTYPVLYSKGGNIQVYGTTREFRPRREVFSRASMDTGIGAPWELRHSADLLNPGTVRGVVRGAVLTVDEYHDGVHTFGWARAWDASLIHAIEGDGVTRPEAPEVSVAYRCKVHREPGTDDFGNPFDQWISDILWNSLASEPYGRAETAKVLGLRSDAEPITVHGANELLALAQGNGLPSRPVIFDPGSWARFDAAAMPRPSAPESPRPSADQPNTRKDETPMLKKLIKHAMALGMAEDAIATAIGVPADGLAAFMEGETDLTPDQLNALVMALPDKPAVPAGDAEPPPAETLVKVEIGDAEYMVPAAVAEEIAAMVGKAKTDGEEMAMQKDRADRAAKRADAAEAELARAEVELAKRADALADMVTRADAQTMATEYGTRLAEAMELCRLGHGAEWQPEARKDAEGAEEPVSLDDWQRAAITAAFGERADGVLARIDAAPNAEARAYAMDMRLADARGLLAEKQHKGKAAIAALNRMRDENARADQQQLNGDDDDPLAAAHKNNRKFDAAPVGVPQTITNPGAA